MLMYTLSIYDYICPKSLARVHDISSHDANAVTTLLSLLGSNLFQSNLIPSASIYLYMYIYLPAYLSINLSISYLYRIYPVLSFRSIQPMVTAHVEHPFLSLSLSRHLGFQPGGQQLLITSAKYVKRLWWLYVFVHLATHGDLTWFWCNKSGCTKKKSTTNVKKKKTLGFYQQEWICMVII